jgi:uncharacterized RDD family membrane protein YckC
MTTSRPLSALIVAASILAASPDAHAQVESTASRPRPPVSLSLAERVQQLEAQDDYRWTRRPVFTLWQDYLLRADDRVRHVVVVNGSAVIEGRVEGDLFVALGPLRLASTAVVGSVLAVAGDVTIEQGAVIRRELVVVGGRLDAPPSFAPGDDQIIIGTAALGERLRSVMPWLTRGLLWGRVVVPDLGWVWTMLGFVLIVSLALNVTLHEPVSQSADQLGEKPMSAFMTGLLILLLTGPVAVLLAATVIGLAILPFVLCAVLVAWTVGKVGVARWLGRSVIGAREDESRARGAIAFLTGFAGIVLLYMVPVIGLTVWAMSGVFGLGAASLAFLAALRRERPAPVPPPAPPVEPPPAPPVEPPPAEPPSPPVGGPRPSPGEFSGAGASGAAYSSPLPREPALAAAGPAVAAAVPGAIDPALFPRATFLERAAGFALDVALVLIVNGLLDLTRYPGQLLALLLIYFIGFIAWKGTTVGGIICNLRVILTTGARPRFSDAVVRGLSSVFSFAVVGLGVLWVLRDPERQSWHDKIAGTYVIKVPRDWPLP